MVSLEETLFMYFLLWSQSCIIVLVGVMVTMNGFKKNTKKHSFCFNMGRIHFIVCLMSEHVLLNNKQDPEVKHFAFI